jgi:hypothetical protein
MKDAAIPPERVFGGTPESVEFRRTHYRVYDEDGFASSFAIGPPDHATLASVSARLCEKFAGTGGTGYESKDLVVLLGPRIVAVVRGGPDGRPRVTTFED